jgi:uncharacterized RDD family membrane protein YckC
MQLVLRRILAFYIDCAVLAGYAGILFLFISPLVRPLFLQSAFLAELTGFLLLTLPLVLYFVICEASPWSATLGKRLLKLQVVKTKGLKKISFIQSVKRSILKFAPWELAHFAIWNVFIFQSPLNTLGIVALIVCYLLVITYGVGLLLKQHRPLYDRFAGTVVIRQK